MVFKAPAHPPLDSLERPTGSMRATDIDLRQSLEFRPDLGQILLGSERMVLFNQRAMLALHELLHKNLGPTLTRAFQAQFGDRCGASDYAVVTALHDWETEIDKLASGPVMHTWEGIVHVEPREIDYDRKAGHFFMTGMMSSAERPWSSDKR